MDHPAISPVLDCEAVCFTQNVVVGNLNIRQSLLGQMDRGLPEFPVEILKRHRFFDFAIAKHFMIACKQERLSGLRVKAQLENQFHEPVCLSDLGFSFKGSRFFVQLR